MSAQRKACYRFSRVAQWRACLFARAEIIAEGTEARVRPFPPYQGCVAPSFVSNGAVAPAATRGRIVLWRDGEGELLRLGEGDARPEAFPAPAAIAGAMRMLGTESDVWTAGGAGQPLQCFDVETLSRRFTICLPDTRLIDIAADVRDGIVALVEHQRRYECIPVSCVGTVGDATVLEGLTVVRGFAHLHAAGRYAVWTRQNGTPCEGDILQWFSSDGGHLRATQLAIYAPCFRATAIAGNGRDRVFVAGADNDGAGPRCHVLVFDGDGVLVDDVALAESATGISATWDSLLVTGQHGLYRLPANDTVPDDVQEVRALFITPVLESPEASDGRRWLRVEITGDLPPGTTMEVACAATSDEAVRDRLRAIAEDTFLAPSRRLDRLRALPDVWRSAMSFHGEAATRPNAGIPLAAPLYDVHERFLWLCVTLSAGAGAALPSISQMCVLYAGNTLMENLPAIYRREESNPGSFLRALVGVLETTTQSLDARIAALGSHIEPTTAEPRWLDYVARWLGLPWDDALETAQKRCILVHARDIARGRGTRAGLETLLACLLPSTHRYRVIDFTVDYGIATLGGGNCHGSRLPALLGGLPASAARLDIQATLGVMRLPCDGEEADATSRLIGKVLVDIAASTQEQERWSPWLKSVLAEMLPVTARLELRWVGPRGLRDDRLDDDFVLAPPPLPLLGSEAVLGAARLPEAAATLPVVGLDPPPTLH